MQSHVSLRERDQSASTVIGQPASTLPNRLRSAFSEDPDMREVLEEFIAELPVQVARIASLLGRGNMDDLRRACHQLKGAGGGYGFDIITTRAAAAENCLKAGDTLDRIADEVNQLLVMLRSVEGYDPRRESKGMRVSGGIS